MTTTTEQSAALQSVGTNFKQANPAGYKVVTAATENSLSSVDLSKAIKAGDKFPAFRLTDATGKEVASQDLLEQGGFLITFYRGSWCPYCNVAVQHLQRHLEEFKARGVTLVAVTPEGPDYSMSMTEKHDLKFPVLTDPHNALARKLGIVYNQGWARPFHAKLGIDLKARNGEDTWEVPCPATLLVDRTGVVRNVFLEVDFRQRLEPKVALEWIDQMNGSS